MIPEKQVRSLSNILKKLIPDLSSFVRNSTEKNKVCHGDTLREEKWQK